MEKLSELQELKREKMLLEMKKEIENMEFQVRHKNITKVENTVKRRTLLSLCYLRHVAPCLATLGLTAAISSSVFGRTPFVLDDVRKYKEIKEEIDSNGNVRYEEQYAQYDEYNKVKYYGEWQKIDENTYKRTVRVYQLSSDMNTLDSVENINSSDAFYQEVYEIRKDLTEEEINAPAFMQGEFYSKDNNEYIYGKENFSEEFTFSLAWLVFNALMLPYTVENKHIKFDYEGTKKNIKEKYKNVDFKELEKKLIIKRSNYNRLMR